MKTREIIGESHKIKICKRLIVSSVKIIGSVIKYMLAPLLFSVYPAIFLYTHNVEILLLGQLIIPLLSASLLAIFIFLLFWLTLKDKSQASLVTVCFVILFWHYGLLFEGITKFVNLNHWHILPITLVAYGHLVYLIRIIHRRYGLENINKIALGVAAVLIMYNLVALIPAEVKKHQRLGHYSSYQQEGNVTSHTGGSYPDIYFIILDEYASLETINEEWGYDNSCLKDFLKSKGFFIAPNSEHRYSQTLWNMTTLLNLKYLTDPVDKEIFLDYVYNREKVKTHDSYGMLSQCSPSLLFEMLNSNKLTGFLKQRGYKIIILEGISQHYKCFNIRRSDVVFSYQDVGKSQMQSLRGSAFLTELVRKTVLVPFYYNEAAFNRSYVATKYVFDYLKRDARSIHGPKFIYAHVMCPHNPYVFDRGGLPVTYNPYDSIKKEGQYVLPNESVNNAYLDQYIYVTKELMNTIDNHFQNTRPSNKIFIIQNDHGPRPHELYLKDKTQPFKALNAVYFPDGDYSQLYDNIAPVNALRVMLNKYFDENYEMLQDR